MAKMAKNPSSGGFVLFIVLLFTIALVGIAIGVFKSIQSFRRLNISDVVGTKLVLESSLDYVVNGIQKQWCFDDYFVPSASCGANDEGYTARLSLPEQTLRGRLKTTSNISAISPNPRRPMLSKILFKSLTSSHPLKFAVNQLSEKNLDSMALCTQVRRLDKDDHYTKYLPGSNGEALGFLLVRVSLISDSVSCTENLQARPAIQSVIVVYPRELNEFALIVARNLDFSKQGSSVRSGGGDLSFPGFSDMRTRNGANVKGVNFLSPVYVNHSLVYWGGNANSTVNTYPKVGFHAPVFLGDQIEMTDGYVATKYEPPSASPAKWSEILFSGLLHGVRVEAQNDLGLDVLSGQFSPAIADAAHDTFQACLNEARVSVNKDATVGSKLLVKQTEAPVTQSVGTSNVSIFHYRIGLSENNKFVSDLTRAVAVSAAGRPIFCTAHATGCNELVANAGINLRSTAGFGPIMNVRIRPRLGGGSVSYFGSLSMSADLTVPLDVYYRKDPDSTYVSSDPSIEMITEPYRVNGVIQPDQFSLTVKLTEFKNNMDRFDLSIMPFVLGNEDNRSSLDWTSGGMISLKSQAGDPVSDEFGAAKTAWKTTATTTLADGCDESNGSCLLTEIADPKDVLPDDQSTRGENLAKCQQNNNWATAKGSFLPDSRFSWSFAMEAGIRQTFDAGTNKVFLTRSIMQECVVEPDATLIAGFFVCDKLTIKGGRTQPLEFIGTLIVTKESDIDRSAVENGITFSSIHESSAIAKLQAAKILPVPKIDAGIPWWHPALSIQQVSQIQNALPSVLRTSAIPFQWTAVDPDCGTIPGAKETTCDKEIKNLVVSELGSKFDL
jgi:hypothetical protein